MRLWLMLMLVGASQAAVLRSGDLGLTVDPAGCGLVDRLALGNADLVSSRPGFVGASLTLAPAGDGTLASLWRHQAAETLPARIGRVAEEAGRLVVDGAYTDGRLRVPFRRTLNLAADGLTVEEEADFTALPAERLVARWRLVLALALPADEHERLLGLGGQSRAELFRMDENDVTRTNQYISDNRAYTPYWDRGGLVQWPGGYTLWKANHADTLAMPLEEGTQCAGWADFSSPRAGLTLSLIEPASPYALTVDARAGELAYEPMPSAAAPLSGAALGRRTVRYRLLPHAGSWPATYVCELPRARYEELLRWLDYKAPGQSDSNLSFYGAHGLGSGDVPTIIDKLRIQPSTVLRVFYAGDAWRMAGFVKAILGRDVPRNQPLAEWDKLAQSILDKVRREGLPKR